VRRSTLEELARDPVGRWVAGESFVHFCAAPSLWGVILWGRPDREAAARLGQSLVLELRSPARPHVSLVDASRLEGGDPAAFGATDRYLARHQKQLASFVKKLALIRPRGLHGALVAGAFEVLPRPYPVSVFDELDRAFAWLGREHDWPPAEFIADLFGEASGVSPVVGALRAFLDANLHATIAEATSALHLSPRTLQRKLGEAQTTFQDELAEARVRAAKRLLLEGDAPVTAIAFDVGCASLQHFSALFRKRTKMSPSHFRKQHR
jgi:AraC-like DNA-binding protein